MAFSLSKYPLVLLILIYPFLCLMSKATDTLKPGDELRDNKTLVSSNNMFELGFFTTGVNYYLGTWFKNDPLKKPIWLASRENPLVDSQGVLSIRYDGNLVMADRRQIQILVNSDMLATTNNTIAVLLDSGNFVLKEGEKVVWESFFYPTDTLLAGMKLGWLNLGPNQRQQYLISWQSPYVPSTGSFVLAPYWYNRTEMRVWHRDELSIKIGNWDGNRFRANPNSSLDNYNFSYVSNSDEVYFTFENQRNDSISWLVMSSLGKIEQYTMNKISNSITVVNNYICEGANAENFTNCFIERPVTCEKGNNFFEVKGMMPNITSTNDSVHLGISDCEITCRSNCSCAGFTTYRDDDGTGCVFYYGDSDVFAGLAGQGNRTIFVRGSDKRKGVDDLSKSKTVKLRLLWLIVIVPVTLIVVAVIFNRRKRAHSCLAQMKQQDSIRRNLEMFLHQYGSSAEVDNLTSSSHKFKFVKQRDHELPIISLSCIETATNNFSVANELGEGGFGHVYKGMLMGHEIAVKRLSQRSLQGLEEFRNEVQLISRLQHRNLVRLLGCCIEKDEKILIYEYLSNKSLDSFLFDPRKKSLLHWDRRMHIIEGVAQGLLYLHKYSRLRIIHRDLKTSNILLDNDMNPKISDFGMARILGENEARARTTRVVGTYGYMSPEYAIRGLFSTKSDVFSFGVIMLEIISGRKNTTFSDPELSLSLLGYAWEMWKAGRGMEFADAAIANTCSATEVSLCLHIALLCVQERLEDRPNMSDVVFMLSNESSNLPIPKQPAFTFLSSCFISPLQHDSTANVSGLSVLEGR